MRNLMIIILLAILAGCLKVTEPVNMQEKADIIWTLEGETNSQIQIECSSFNNKHTINKPEWMFMDDVNYGETVSCKITATDTSEEGWLKLTLYVDGIKATSYTNTWIKCERSPGEIYIEYIIEK